MASPKKKAAPKRKRSQAQPAPDMKPPPTLFSHYGPAGHQVIDIVRLPLKVLREAGQMQDESTAASDIVVPMTGQLARRHRLDPNWFGATLNALLEVERFRRRYGHSYDELAAELVKADVIPRASDFVDRIDAFGRDVLERAIATDLRATMVRAILPSYVNLYTRTMAVARYDHEFDPTRQDPAEYTPRVVGAEYRAMAYFTVSQGGHEHVVQFGMTAPQIDRVVNHLRLARIQLDAAMRTTTRSDE